jgi:hypothetical protein
MPPLQEIQRRRIDKITPSSYTFASDSTKLGEIPMQNWTAPFDSEEMRRRNIQLAMNPLTPVAQQLPANEKRRGLLRLFKKKGMSSRPVVVG